MKKWQCTVCKYIHEGDDPPEKCPVCGVPASKFVLLEEETAVEAPTKEPAAATETAAEETAEQPAPEAPQAPAPVSLYDRVTAFMVKHHAHPVTVHMPNGILPAAVILFVLAWFSGSELLVKAGAINLVFVILALPVVLYSGVLEWQKKYMGATTLIFKIKILAATLTTGACVISLAWFLIDPGVLASSRAWAFILINLVMLASAGVAGHIGGKLVFKD